MLSYLFFGSSLGTIAFLYSTLNSFKKREDPIVVVTNGSIQGFRYGKAAVFLGIPFAKPPVGNLRFQKPESYEKWKSPLLAQSFQNACVQASTGDGTAMEEDSNGSTEDCLYLNVMTPQVVRRELLPVMLFIHGGGYLSGSARGQGYKRIVQHWVSRGVVVVTIQYRLNVFGFFTTETEDFPSNVAMLDQIAAMRWVQAEIGAFGGDPGRVTILGESAGAFSVSLHTFSPLSRPFFHQALAQSGTGYCPWALYGNQNRYHNASKDFAVATKCITAEQWDAKDFSRFTSCVRNLSAIEIALIRQESVPEVGATHFRTSTLGMNWAPRVGTTEGFLPQPLRELSKKRAKNMPVVIGTARDEMYSWTLKSGEFKIFNRRAFETTVSNYGSELTWGRKAKGVQNVIRKCYLPKKGTDSPFTWFRAIEELESDSVFFSGAYRDAETLLETTSNVYVYSFDYLPKDGWPKYKNQSVKGVPHGKIQSYEFGNADQEIAEIIGKLWTNFAITGDPNKPEKLDSPWKRFTATRPHFFSITKKPITFPSYRIKANLVWNYLVHNASQFKTCKLDENYFDLLSHPNSVRFM